MANRTDAAHENDGATGCYEHPEAPDSPHECWRSLKIDHQNHMENDHAVSGSLYVVVQTWCR